MTNRYIVVGGIPFRSYTGTGTYTGLKVVGSSNNKRAIKKLVKDSYDACGGLLTIIDTTTGKEAEGI